MSWGDIFFGFRGRINRKIYWAGTVLVGVAGFLFAALLAYLATGNPFAPEVWERPADKTSLWEPVWLAYFGFLVWSSTALAVKRLHDRNRPVWIWYVYYILALALTLLPIKASPAAPAPAPSVLGIPAERLSLFISALSLVLAVFAGYIFFELGVFRGQRGPNAYGEDPLPPDYYGGDYNFLSWMFALEGRISRAKWWLGLFVIASVMIVVSFVTGLILNSVMSAFPELQQNFNNPEWLNSKEAEPAITRLGLSMIGPMLIVALAMWSLLALGVKRLHDRGLSSWLILVVVLPFLGAAAALSAPSEVGENVVRVSLLLLTASVIWGILQFGILKGETGPNENGPDPLAG